MATYWNKMSDEAIQKYEAEMNNPDDPTDDELFDREEPTRGPSDPSDDDDDEELDAATRPKRPEREKQNC